MDKRDGDGPDWNIYFSKSVDGGETFGPDVRVDDAGNDDSRQTDPAVAVDDSGRIYVVWLDERGEGFSGVYFSRSMDGGATFDSSIALPNVNEEPPLGVWPQYGPSIAASGDGRVCISYVDQRHVDGGDPMFVCVRRSTDGGQTFSEPVDVANEYYSTLQTSLCGAGSLDVYVAWVVSDDYCFVSRSSDGGATFGPAAQVNGDPALVDVSVSISANSSGWISLAWSDSFNTIGFAESRDWGMSFLPMMTFVGAGDRDYATVAIDEEQNVYVAWTDYRHSDNGDIYLSKGVPDSVSGASHDISDRRSPERLIRITPNPFVSHVTIEYAHSGTAGSVEVYDSLGRVVRRVHCDDGMAQWDGRDERGRRVEPGVYFIGPCGKAHQRAVKLVLCN